MFLKLRNILWTFRIYEIQPNRRTSNTTTQKDSPEGKTEHHTIQHQPVQKMANGNGKIFLYLSAFVVNLISFTAGIALGWPSPMIPKLTSFDKNINQLPSPLTASEAAWVVALLTVGGAIGPLVAGKSAALLGRKRTLLIIAIPMAVSNVIAAFATTVNLFYIARTMQGFVVGCVFSVVPIYLGEIAEDHNRGTLGCFLTVAISFGIFIAYSCGPIFSIQLFCLLCNIPVFAFIILFAVFIPESAVYLVSIGETKRATASLQFMRNKSAEAIEKEILELSKSIEDAKSEVTSFSQMFNSKGVVKGFIIIVGLMFLQQLSGINAVLFYMQIIFDSTGSDIPSNISVMVVGAVQTLTIIICSGLVEKLGRKILLLCSVIGSGLSLIMLGAYFFLKNNNYDVDSIFWLPIVSVLIYIASFNIGLGPLPWAVLGELFPANVKTFASTVGSTTCFLVGFLTCLGFPYLVEFIGMGLSFWLFAVFCAIGSLFVFVFVIETKGKTLLEIQQILNGDVK